MCVGDEGEMTLYVQYRFYTNPHFPHFFVELGMQQHWLDNVTMFSLFQAKTMLITATCLYLLRLLHIDTESSITLSRCRCREAKTLSHVQLCFFFCETYHSKLKYDSSNKFNYKLYIYLTFCGIKIVHVFFTVDSLVKG